MNPHKSRCDASGQAYAGSQRQIQYYVNQQAGLLNRAIEEAYGRTLQPQWVSPLASARYQEYRDDAFPKAVGMNQYSAELRSFWPKNGPVWDALARIERRGVLLVEAKSHIREIYAGSCTARAPRSLKMIDRALDQTKGWLDADRSTNWRGKHTYCYRGKQMNGSLYQLANCIAHLYFFREVLKVEAWLVNLYFVEDPRTPTSKATWEAELAEVRRKLGIRLVPFYADVFLSAVNPTHFRIPAQPTSSRS